jgi:hypothetical protein
MSYHDYEGVEGQLRGIRQSLSSATGDNVTGSVYGHAFAWVLKQIEKDMLCNAGGYKELKPWSGFELKTEMALYAADEFLKICKKRKFR